MGLFDYLNLIFLSLHKDAVMLTPGILVADVNTKHPFIPFPLLFVVIFCCALTNKACLEIRETKEQVLATSYLANFPTEKVQALVSAPPYHHSPPSHITSSFLLSSAGIKVCAITVWPLKLGSD